MAEDVIKLVTDRLASLAPRLRQAAKFIIDNPEAVALKSMRTVAAEAEVQPSAMVRLAVQLGFASYDELRERFQSRLTTRGAASWQTRARKILGRRHPAESLGLIDEFARQECANLQETLAIPNYDNLIKAARAIQAARSVYVLGLRSLYPTAFYFHYVCRMFMSKTVLLTGTGGTFADDLRTMIDRDVLIAFSYQPYARDAVRGVRFARGRGAQVIAVTDSLAAPIIKGEEIGIVVASTSQSLFPSVLPALAVAQTIVGLLLAESGEESMAAIGRSETQLNAFDVYED